MKASELNGGHLGHRVSISENGNSATGVLGEILHRSNVIVDERFGQSFESIGRRWVDVELLGGFNARVTPNAEVTIHG